MPARRALVLDDLAQLGRRARAASAGSSCGGVGDAEAAAEVELGQLDAVLVADLRVQRDAPGARPPRSRRCRRSASRCAQCRPTQLEAGDRAAPGAPPRSARRWRSRSRTSGPRAPVAMYSWVCASTPAVTRTQTRCGRRPARGERASRVDLVERVDDDPPDAGVDARGRARRRDLLLPWKPIRSGGKPARSATASSPPVQTSRLRPSSATQRATARAQERLAGVEDVVSPPNASRNARQRARKSASSSTYAGVPCSATRSRTSTPPTSSTPSRARARSATAAAPGR